MTALRAGGRPGGRRGRAPWGWVLSLLLVGCGGGPGEEVTTSPTSPVATHTEAGPTATLPSRPSGPVAEPLDVATGLAVAWGLDFLPDGAALVTARDTGEVVLVRRDGAPRSLGVVPDVQHGGEGGLLGLAVSPDVAEDGAVFVYLTTAEDNRVVRLRLDDARDPHGFTVEDAVLRGIPRGSNHNGGRIAFGPDGLLYVATGDAGDRSHAQDAASLGGKILRITADGDPAPGNPWPGSPVWSTGHRNVQGLAWDEQGRLFASEFGQNAWDELNLIEPGSNYGWPEVEGRGGRGDFVDPLVQWRPAEASPSGVAVSDGAVYVAALRGEALWRVPLTGAGTGEVVVGEPERLLAGVYGRLRAVAADGEGNLWLLTSNTARGAVRPGDDRVVVVNVQSIGGAAPT